MDLKDKEYLIRVTEYDGLDYDSIVFTQNDTNNCRLNVEMFEKVDQLVIIIDKNDNTQVVDTLTYVDGNKYTYDMPISTINVTGNHRGYLVAYGHEDDRRTLGNFKYKVNAEPSVENIATDTEYPILTQLISDTSALNNTITEKEIIRDDYYLETIERENARNDSEIKRVTSENNRVAEFNGIKSEFEDLKKVAIDDNAAVNLQNQINETNTQLENKASKQSVEEIVVNVEDFPRLAVETNDSHRIQRAIDYAKNNNLTKIMLIANVYYISTPLKMYENISLVGKNGGGMYANVGNLTVLKLSDNANCNMFEIDNGVKFCVLDNLYLAGNKDNNTLGSGIHIKDNSTQECQLLINRCVITKFAEYGVYIGSGMRANKIINTTVLENNKSGIIVNASDCHIEKCLIGLNVEDGIQVKSYVTKITNCDIFTNRTGINIYSTGRNTHVSGCGIDRNMRHGIYINALNCSIIGGTIRTNSQELDGGYPNIQVQDVETTIIGTCFGYDGGYTKKPIYDIIASTSSRVNAFGLLTDGISSKSGLINDRTKFVGLKQSYSNNAIPTTGSWKIGDYVENTSIYEFGVSGSKYIVLGWKRLTTGSTNVLNVDWLECRTLTGN